MRLSLKQIRTMPDEIFQRLTGVKKITFESIVSCLKPKWRKRRRSGGPEPNLNLVNQILLTLSYWRNYGTYLETGSKFRVSESTAYKICRWVEDNIKDEKIFHLQGKKALLEPIKEDFVVIDVTECPIERPKKKKKGRIKNRQKLYYSGKKKRHSIKQQIVINAPGKKIISTAMDKGRVHDFKLYKKSKTHIYKETEIKVDLGFQGIQKIHENSSLPQKKSKKQPLTSEQKKNNTLHASQRIIVEHVIGFIKKFKIIAQRYRNRRRRFGLRFNLICAIYNMERSNKS